MHKELSWLPLGLPMDGKPLSDGHGIQLDDLMDFDDIQNLQH